MLWIHVSTRKYKSYTEQPEDQCPTKMNKVAITTCSFLNKKYVEDNVINMYETYQLHPPYGF